MWGSCVLECVAFQYKSQSGVSFSLLTLRSWKFLKSLVETALEWRWSTFLCQQSAFDFLLLWSAPTASYSDSISSWSCKNWSGHQKSFSWPSITVISSHSQPVPSVIPCAPASPWFGDMFHAWAAHLVFFCALFEVWNKTAAGTRLAGSWLRTLTLLIINEAETSLQLFNSLLLGTNTWLWGSKLSSEKTVTLWG